MRNTSWGYFLYMLLDPDSREIVYIGATGNRSQRKSAHAQASSGNRRMATYKKWLLGQNKRLVFHIVANFEDALELMKQEKHFIEAFQPIFNIKDNPLYKYKYHV